VVEQTSGPLLARAASGVCYAGFDDPGEAAAWAARAAAEGCKAVVEYAPPAAKEKLEMWPAPGSDFETMRRIKEMFDPRRLLNPGRLYGRL
jgi:glycolate oxidase FAD binding subunit